MAEVEGGELRIVVVPANEARWSDIRAVFGSRGDPAACHCQWFKEGAREFDALSPSARAERMRAQTACGDAEAPSTSGLVAFCDGEPVGWVAVEPRTAYSRLRSMRVPWTGRDEDPDDATVWAVTCFVVRTGHRRRGVGRALVAATVDFARSRGARALEGYPLLPSGGTAAAELFVGTPALFGSAGFKQVGAPTERRRVYRIELS